MDSNAFMNDLKQVYHWMEDEASRELFINRTCYNITQDNKYLKNMLEWNSRLRKHRVYDSCETPKLFREKVAELSHGKKVVIYGAGIQGKTALKLLENMPVSYFCDRSPKLQEEGFMGIQVISPDRLCEEYKDLLVIIGSDTYNDEIYQYLCSHSFQESQILCIRDYIPFYLSDVQYFEEDFLDFSGEQVFIDGGCFTFDTCKRLLEVCSTVKKIYAFEPVEELYEQCKLQIEERGLENIVLQNKGIWSSEAALSFQTRDNGGSHIAQDGIETIQVVAIDDIINEKVTFIKMDVEGAELEALKGAREIIKKYRPTLAICIYHKPEDIIEIPKFIKSLVSDYKLYIRHYTNVQYETVLYAV